MRILLGAGTVTEQAGSPAVRLIKRLRFNAVQVEAVRVVQTPIFPVGEPGMGSAFVYDDLFREATSHAKLMTDALAIELGAASVGGQVLHGNPASAILNRADETRADLIAVDGHEYKPIVAALIGSVARALLLGARQSVLLAKASDALPDRPVRAVLATDHSEYANACWEHLVRFWPRGIEHLTILTSYPEGELKAMDPLLPAMGISVTQAVHDQLCVLNAALMKRLQGCFHPSLTTMDSVVSPLPVHEAIAAQMKASDADLLILGAQGHGFLERLTMGSVALREALTLAHSTLVIRK
jgi:nucleotide-binding universal stress UspA family protein